MDNPVVEDHSTFEAEEHIKYEAEEAEHLADHVWEEVVIEDENVPAWKQDLEIEGDSNTELTMESTASESEEAAVEGVHTEESVESLNNEANGEVITGDINPDDTDYNSGQNGAAESVEAEMPTATAATIDAVEAIVVDPNAEDGAVPTATNTEVLTPAVQTTQNRVAPIPGMPIVTQVTSLARPNIQKVVNLNGLKFLPKEGGYVNIGNRKVKLVPLGSDKKLVGGKIVRIANANTITGAGKNLVGKIINFPRSPEKKLIPAKVVSVPSTKNISNISPASIVGNKVIPAKVVSVPNTKLRPIAPSPGKEVTIYITGLAGDKVHVKDSGQLLTTATRVPIQIAPQQISDGHFLLQGSDNNQGTTTFACNVCDRQFTQLKYLLSHQQTHILPEPVSCDSCDKTFKRRYDLVRHKRRAHVDNTIYQCDVCHKQFSDRLVANRHRLTHTEEFKYCCEVCSRPFKFIHDLKRHRSIHFDEKPFDCEICGKKFKHKSNLKTHQATHYSEKPYSCTLCDKKFHQKGNLKTHLIVHTGEMPFICTMCSKRFHTRSGLLNHSYSHSDEKPFQCEICDKTFNWKSGLLTHQQTHRQRLPGGEEMEVIEIGPIHVDPSQLVEQVDQDVEHITADHLTAV